MMAFFPPPTETYYARCEQLSQITYKNKEIVKEEIPSLSRFIITQPVCSYYKKGVFGTPKTVMCNQETQEMYVLLKEKISDIGTFKKVTSAVFLPPLASKQSACLVAQWVSRDNLVPSDYELCCRDAKLHKLFSGCPGIWPLHFCVKYVKQKTNKEKVTAFAPLATGSLDTIKIPDWKALIDVAFQLIQGVHSLHQKGYIHGDIKSPNVLFKVTNAPEKKFVVGFNDFGFSFEVGKEKPSFVFQEGYYGSVDCTPPELFGNCRFAGDYFKTDIWALGVLLAWLRGKPLDWKTFIANCYKLGNGIYEEEITFVRAKINRLIEVNFLLLEQRQPLVDPLEQLDFLIYKMLRLDPARRPDAGALLQEITRIRSSIIS